MTATLAHAAALPSGRLLHAQGDWRAGHALDGPRPHSTERPALLEADRRRHHPFPLGHEPRRGPTDPQPLPVHVALGVRVCGLAARVGRVRAQAAGGERAEPTAHARRSGGLVGSGHPAHQHALPKRPAHARVRQGVARAHSVQGVPDHAPEPVLVDASAARRQAVEPEQLPHRHDPGPGRRRGDPRTYALQGHVLPHMGRPLLGEGERLRGVDEVQEAHERAALGPQPDPEPALHALVVAHDQPRQRLRRLSGAARPDGHLHARQDPDAQDLADPDLPRAPVAKDPRVGRDGPVPGL